MLSYLKKIGHNEDNLIAIGIAWTVGLAFFTLGGFYFTTIAGSAHVVDLQEADMIGGLRGMLVGFIVGVIVATFITIQYPKWTAADEAAEHH
jgi:hypothetical protein